MPTLKNILPRLAALEGNLEQELARLARLRSQGKLHWSGGKMQGIGRIQATAKIRLKIDSFRSQIMSFDKNQCWEWEGPHDELGYGRIKIQQVLVLAHRFSFAVFNQRDPQRFVCHSCDNPKCVNPDHLFEGTQTDNMHDCSVKGRFGDRRGELSACHKLNDEAVREIRASSGWREFAAKYGVSKSAVYQARNSQTWSHVTP